ncbi:hypothetical protein EOM82_01905 [bacterium]|nr:hypothetical protein [bacterium]
MDKIYIRRQDEKIKVGEKNFDEEDVRLDTYEHINSVFSTFSGLFNYGVRKVKNHDKTKLQRLGLFTRALMTNFDKDVITEEYWKEVHFAEERHHLNDRVPDDVDLLDVLEMLCDCVCAAKARSGKITMPIEISADVLLKAVDNTVKLLDENVEVLNESLKVIV